MTEKTQGYAVESITDSDESYAGDLQMMRDCSTVATATILPHMEILQAQMGAELSAEIAELAEAAQLADTASQEAIAAIRAENDAVAEAHNEHPDARTDKAYYHEG